MADRNTNWDRERDNERNYERNDWREDAWRRGSESEGSGDRFRERGNEQQQRGRYSPRGDYGPSAFNHGAGQDNELYGTGTRGYGSTWGGSGVYREGQDLYRGQQGYGGQGQNQQWENQRNQQWQNQPNQQWQNQQGQHTGKGPKGYSRSDDRIREDVCECLTRHGHVDATEIEVRVKDGEVTLTGMVNRREEKRIAEDAVENVPGVRDVHNQLRTQAQGQGQGQSQAHNQSMNAEHNLEHAAAGGRRR
ncbi:MAG: transport-associated protein [Candidatus Solibacter sp.]|jgi:osmotically-inducible protein OsmY|nr:transport-associated protein [Candidatus Solibacter sp.]